MKSLSEVLNRLQPLLMQKEPSNDTSPMQEHGSTSTDGNSTTPSQATGLMVRPETNPTLRVKQSTELSTKWKNPVSSDRQGREDLKEFILMCFDTLDTYGKSPGQLANAAKLFLLMLKDYPVILVRKAFEKWIKEKTDMPKPADIINIIEEDNSRVLGFVTYVRGGGNLEEFAEKEVKSILGNNWRYVYV